MGMMAKMRSLAPWFIVTVGGLFVLFMVLSDSKIADAIGTRSNDIGKVNGEKISYQEFANLLDRYREFQLKQNGQTSNLRLRRKTKTKARHRYFSESSIYNNGTKR